MKNIEKMVIDSLKRQGLDGLFNSAAECACQISDLFPCGEPSMNECHPGRKDPCDCEEEHAFHISNVVNAEDTK